MGDTIMGNNSSRVHLASTLIEILRSRADRQANTRAYTFLVDGETEEKHLTYADLDGQARAIGAYLQQLKAKGERVLLLYPPGLDFIAAFFGCLYSGNIAVPVYPPHVIRLDRTLQKFRAVVNDAKPAVALTTSEILSLGGSLFFQDPQFKMLQWIATDVIDPQLSNTWEDPEIDEGHLAYLQYTSGSTTTPRGVMITHRNVLSNSGLIQKCFEHTDSSKGMIWLPPYHDMGLIGGVIQPLYVGFHVTLMSPLDFLQRPYRWLHTISRIRATTSGGPNFAYDLCLRKITPEQIANLDLSSWEVAFNGAEPVRHETLEEFAEKFKDCGFRRQSFYPCYGLAEGTLIVSGGSKSSDPQLYKVEHELNQQNGTVSESANGLPGQILISSGRTLAGQTILIVDPETRQERRQEQIGEIWVSGPSIAKGYWRNPELTEYTFHANLADKTAGPFLRSGDLGFLKQGELYVTGRLKDLIIIDGRNIYPQDIEWTVEGSHLALRSGCSSAFSIDENGQEHLIVVAEADLRRLRREVEQNGTAITEADQRLKMQLDGVKRAIRQAVAEQHDVQVYHILLIKAGNLPKTSSGKVQRYLCRANYIGQTFEEVR